MVTLAVFSSGMQGPMIVKVDVEICLDDEREAKILARALSISVRAAYCHIAGIHVVPEDISFKALEGESEEGKGG